jgi:hypothetical protein
VGSVGPFASATCRPRSPAPGCTSARGCSASRCSACARPWCARRCQAPPHPGVAEALQFETDAALLLTR